MLKLFKKYSVLIILSFIVLFAGFLRFYELGNNPPSLDWDEASLGYNAYSILKTGKDEYGNSFPISIRSFDDYKPAAYTYLTIPSVYFFGLNEFSVRFPSALFGVLTVLATFLLVKELFKINNIALLSSFLLAISPWHLQFSRVAFESNLGVSFFVLGTFLFLKGIKDGKFLIFAFGFFALSFYSYHSIRLILPIFILGLLLYYRKEIWKIKNYFLVGVLAAFILGTPFVANFLSGRGNLSRFSSVTVLTPTGTLDKSIKELQYDKERGDFLGQIFHNRRVVYTLTVLKGYLDHYNLNFLFIQGDGIERHHPVSFGMMYLVELPFLLLGIFYVFNKKIKGRFILFLWFLIAPLASSLTTGTPHPVRALTFLPTFQIFVAFGIFWFISKILKFKSQLLRNTSLLLFFLAFSFNFLYYIHQYYVHTPIEYSQGWQYGYREVFKEAARIESKYEKILITYKYDQPYIFYLFYNKIDPLWYQRNWDYLGTREIERSRRIIGKYEFRNINFGEDSKIPKILIIGDPSEIPEDKTIKEVRFLDGTVAFRFAES